MPKTVLPKAPPSNAAKRSQLPAVVASYVRELIMTGQVRPGEFLRMEPISEAVGVSNTPVREGLFSLENEGLVKQVPRRGFVVAEITAQDIRDLFWAQATLSGELAARTAELADSDLIQQLEEMLEKYELTVENEDAGQIARLGHEFHRAINLAASSNRLANILGSITKQLPNTFYAAIEGQVTATRHEHPEIVRAIKARDAKKARAAMEKHLLDESERLIETLSEAGFWSNED